MDSRDRCPDCGHVDHHGCDAQPWPQIRGRVTYSDDGYVSVLVPKEVAAYPEVGQDITLLWKPPRDDRSSF